MRIETKYPDDLPKTLDELSRFYDEKSMGARALADLIRHSRDKIDTVFHDGHQLCESNYDTFRFGVGLAYTVLLRFEGLAKDMLGEGFTTLDRHDRLRAIADIVYILTAEADEMKRFSENQKMVHMLISLMLSAKFAKGGKSAEHQKILSAILSGFEEEAKARKRGR